MTDPLTSPCPTLTLAERERRLASMRELMRERGVRALIVPPGPRMNPIDSYFTNDVPNSAVVVPLEGDPVAIHRSPGLMGALVQAEQRGEQSWIDDWRFQPLGLGIVGAITDLGLAREHLGVVGVFRATPLYPNGWTPAGLWADVVAGLPDARFTELWDDFALRWLVKSDEELALFRRAAAIAERACGAMVATAGVGVSEADVYGATQEAILAAGAETSALILHTGQDNVSWGLPSWLHRAQEPPRLSPGDVVLSEMFPSVGGLEAQAQMCIGVGSLHDDFHRAAVAAKAAYDEGRRALGPGVTFGEVALAMDEAILSRGAWYLTPQVHSLTPLALIGPVMQGTLPAALEPYLPPAGYPRSVPGPLGSSTQIQPGMTFQLEANAVYGRRRINVGGNVIVTDDGCLALNDLPTELRLVPA